MGLITLHSFPEPSVNTPLESLRLLFIAQDTHKEICKVKFIKFVHQFTSLYTSYNNPGWSHFLYSFYIQNPVLVATNHIQKMKNSVIISFAQYHQLGTVGLVVKTPASHAGGPGFNPRTVYFF